MKIKGHTTIILKDVNTGKIERHEDDNMMTNALTNYFANCGFMNYPNINKNNMVELLLGGVMAFNDEISESASTVQVPAGLKMIANGSVGTINNSEVLELGSYSTTESGWQDDGSYIQTYDYTTTQANGTIACVCLTGKNYGYAGEGNSISHVRHTTKASIIDIAGDSTNLTGILGEPFNIDLSDSSCNTFAIETRTDAQTDEEYKVGVLRKYRLPISKINLKATLSSPILLSESEINLDNDLANATCILTQPLGNKLIVWNNCNKPTAAGPIWGQDFTQYIWEVTKTGSITKSTIANTSGYTQRCLGNAIFDGNYCFFGMVFADSYGAMIDMNYIFILNRTTGNMTRIQNPYTTLSNGAYRVSGTGEQVTYYRSGEYNGLQFLHGSGDGRIVILGRDPIVIDGVNNTIYPTNSQALSSTTRFLYPTSSPLIWAKYLKSNGQINFYRDQGYIASINNLDTPVVKTAEKTMKIIYRLTFEEEENE